MPKDIVHPKLIVVYQCKLQGHNTSSPPTTRL